MDEAFMSFQQILERMLAFGGEIGDASLGVRFYIDACEIESPVELNVFRDEHGALRIGSTPPLYNVATSILPSFHRLRFSAQRSEAPDAG